MFNAVQANNTACGESEKDCFNIYFEKISFRQKAA